MIVNKTNKGFLTNSMFPSSNWLGEEEQDNWYIVDDSSELAQKINANYPYYDFVLDGDNLADITPTERPIIEPIPSDVEILQAKIDVLETDKLAQAEIILDLLMWKLESEV